MLVRLDSQSRVVGFTNSDRPRPGWVEPPADVARDPLGYRQDADGAWIAMTPEERVQRDLDHA